MKSPAATTPSKPNRGKVPMHPEGSHHGNSRRHSSRLVKLETKAAIASTVVGLVRETHTSVKPLTFFDNRFRFVPVTGKSGLWQVPKHW